MSPGPLIVSLGRLRAQVSPEAWLAPGSVLAGDVVVGSGSSVWYGAVVRAEMSSVAIGMGSNLQDNAVIHVDEGAPAVVEDEVSVGHGAVLHGCLVGTGTVIGMNATVLNHAEVGESSLVAAGAVVPQGAVLPPRSLVAGVPGKVVRELTDDEVAANLVDIRSYVDLARQHRAGLSE